MSLADVVRLELARTVVDGRTGLHLTRAAADEVLKARIATEVRPSSCGRDGRHTAPAGPAVTTCPCGLVTRVPAP